MVVTTIVIQNFRFEIILHLTYSVTVSVTCKVKGAAAGGLANISLHRACTVFPVVCRLPLY